MGTRTRKLLFVRPSELIRREPTIFLAELTWRWSFALGTAAVLMFLVRRVSQALNLAGIVDGGSASPIQRAQSLARTIVLSLPTIWGTLLLACALITLLWIVAATMGRGVVIRAIVRHLADESGNCVSPCFSWLAIAGAQFARAFTLLILVIGYLVAAIAERQILSTDPAYVADPLSVPAPGTLIGVLLAFSAVMGIAVLVWALVHFVASLAPIYIVRDGRGALDALAESVEFVRRRWRVLLHEATQNGTIRSVIALIISACAFLIGALWARSAPALAWTLITTLMFVYCVCSDWFLLSRTVAYAQIAEEDKKAAVAVKTSESEVSDS